MKSLTRKRSRNINRRKFTFKNKSFESKRGLSWRVKVRKITGTSKSVSEINKLKVKLKHKQKRYNEQS